MISKNDIEIVTGFLEENYEEFYTHLELNLEIEGTEAELLIDKLKGIAHTLV